MTCAGLRDRLPAPTLGTVFHGKTRYIHLRTFSLQLGTALDSRPQGRANLHGTTALRIFGVTVRRSNRKLHFMPFRIRWKGPSTCRRRRVAPLSISSVLHFKTTLPLRLNTPSQTSIQLRKSTSFLPTHLPPPDAFRRAGSLGDFSIACYSFPFDAYSITISDSF